MSDREKFKDLTDQQLIDLEERLYDDEIAGNGTWFERDQILQELNWRKLASNQPKVRMFIELKEGEEWKPDLLVDLPQGFRLETDEEFRQRILNGGS